LGYSAGSSFINKVLPNDEIKFITNLPNNNLVTAAGKPDRHWGCVEVRKCGIVEARRLVCEGGI
jgi:hypothetical protein